MAGYRSLLAFWMGGAGAPPTATAPTISGYVAIETDIGVLFLAVLS
jgi:hypothetical protein